MVRKMEDRIWKLKLKKMIEYGRKNPSPMFAKPKYAKSIDDVEKANEMITERNSDDNIFYRPSKKENRIDEKFLEESIKYLNSPVKMLSPNPAPTKHSLIFDYLNENSIFDDLKGKRFPAMEVYISEIEKVISKKVDLKKTIKELIEGKDPIKDYEKAKKEYETTGLIEVPETTVRIKTRTELEMEIQRLEEKVRRLQIENSVRASIEAEKKKIEQRPKKFEIPMYNGFYVTNYVEKVDPEITKRFKELKKNDE